jgi:hypothetical protein
MIVCLLNSPAGKLQLVSSAAGDLDVAVTGAVTDATIGGASDVVPTTTLTNIPTATTTDIRAAPAASKVDDVKFISVRNVHATVANDVTVLVDLAGTDYELFKCTLLPGEHLVCHEGTWFHFDANGGVYGATVELEDPRFITKRLLADQSNSTVTLTEVVGLTVPCGIGVWHFKYILRVQSAAATTGHRFSVNHDGTVAWFLATVDWSGNSNAAASDTLDQDFVVAGGQVPSRFSARAKSTAGWGTTLGVDTLNADVLYEVEGITEVTVAGNLELWHGSEVAAASTVKAGSLLVLDKAG